MSTLAKAQKAVKAIREYMGSDGLPIKTQQRFYNRMMKAMDGLEMYRDAIEARANELGPIHLRPGKDY